MSADTPLEEMDEMIAEIPSELVCLDILLTLGDQAADR
jgi:hypothetical protein